MVKQQLRPVLPQPHWALVQQAQLRGELASSKLEVRSCSIRQRLASDRRKRHRPVCVHFTPQLRLGEVLL